MSNALDRIASGDFFLIAGPCVAESQELCNEIAESVMRLAQKFDIPFVFKASYQKANRTSASAYTGPGLDQGIAILSSIKERYNLPILTDIHEANEVESVAAVADILQIPAFLSRQTDLIAAAGATGKWVNIKKGQFLAPEDMKHAVEKANSEKVMLTERGSSFGYHNLIVDFRSLTIMRAYGKVVFDASHSLQRPSGDGNASGGQPEMIIPMARAAAAIGIDGLFVETHPNPAKAKSDAKAMLPLNQMEQLLSDVLKVREAINNER